MNVTSQVLFGVSNGSDACGCKAGVILDGCISHTFSVTGKPVIIRGYNLDDEVISVESVAGGHGGEFFSPVKDNCGCKLTLEPKNCDIVLAMPGRYRLNRCSCIDGDEPLGDPQVEVEEIETEINFTLGESSMSCLTYAEICDIIETKIAAIDSTDLALANVIQSPTGWIAIMNDGSTLPFDLDGELACDLVFQSISADPAKQAAWQALLDTDTDTAVAIVAKPPTTAAGVTTTCFDLVDYLTGTVITADYFCITSDVDTTIPDTFGTWNGGSIVFPDGTVYIPTPDTAGTWNGTSVTFPDGTSFTPTADTSGTWDGTNIVFPDGSVYTPSPHTEVTDGGSNLVNDTDPDNIVIRPIKNCANDDIDVLNDRLLTIAEIVSFGAALSIPYVAGDGSVSVDPCRPTLLTDPCLVEMAVETTSQVDGVTLRSDPGSPTWSIISFSPKVLPVVSAAQPIITLDDATLTSLVGAGDTTITTVRVEYTNTDCVRHRVDGEIRSIMSTQLQGGSRGAIALNVTANTSLPQFIQILATPSHNYDVNTSNVGFNRQKGPPIYGALRANGGNPATYVNPGATVVLEFDVDLNVFSHTANPNAIVEIGSSVAAITAHRSI